MKQLLFSLVLLAMPVVVPASDPPTLSGQWAVHNNIAGNESDQACTFVQTGKDLTGSCKSDQSTVTIKGEVNEKKVTWEFKTEYQGDALTIQYNGSIESPSKISGSVTVKEMGVDGEFTAVASK